MLRIRTATEADSEALLAIYAPYVLKTPITFEYLVPSLEEFRQRILDTLQEYPYLVAEDKEQNIVGYAYAHSYKGRSAYDWSVEVTVYVSEAAQGLGAGKLLYQALEESLAAQQVVNLTACITGQNEGSIRFHEKMGYRNVGTFEKIGYKFDRWYDVIWMQKRLEDHSEHRAFIPFSDLRNQGS